MTEYDYSPEAYEAYLATQAKISRWVGKTNRLYPHLGNPFTPAKPAVHDSDLPTDLQKEIHQSSKKGGDRDRQTGRDGEDRHRYRDRNPDRESSESNPGSRSRPPPTRSKTMPVLFYRAPHSRRASYDQYAYKHPKENKFSSSKNDLDSDSHPRYASHSKPDLPPSKTKYRPTSKYDADVPSFSTRRHSHSSSATHLPKNYPQHSRRMATQQLPSPTSAPPLALHSQYLSRREQIPSQTMPPEDRNPWLVPQRPPPPAIPRIAHHPPKGHGYYHARGNGYQNGHRNPPQPPTVAAPLHESGHGHASHTQARERKVESQKHQQPLLKRLLTNLTLAKPTGPPTTTRSPDSHGGRRRSF